MQQPQPAQARPQLILWLVAFGLLVLLIGQFRLAEQIKELQNDRADYSAKLEAANQQIAELSEALRTAEARAATPIVTPSSSQNNDARVADLEQRLNTLLSRVNAAPTRAGFDFTGSNPTVAADPPDTEPGKRGWGEEQATGAPNTPTAIDASTAWATLEPDAGPEWLAVQFARPVDIAEVRIRESYNPGAITRVVAVANNQEITIWQGASNTGSAPRDFVVPVTTSIVSATIHIHLDTAKVPGWNEIDAVELIGKDGSRQWAASATASTTYAARKTASNP